MDKKKKIFFTKFLEKSKESHEALEHSRLGGQWYEVLTSDMVPSFESK